MKKYNPQKIERKWQRYWEAKKLIENCKLIIVPILSRILDGFAIGINFYDLLI